MRSESRSSRPASNRVATHPDASSSSPKLKAPSVATIAVLSRIPAARSNRGSFNEVLGKVAQGA